MKKATLEEYDRRFDLDGEGGDLLCQNATDTVMWLAEHPEAEPAVRRMLEQWLWLTGFTKCPCPSCKRGRGEALLPYEEEYDRRLVAELAEKRGAVST